MSESKHITSSQFAKCESMARFQSLVSGKWKILILWYISVYEVQRFNELMRRLGDITQSTLTKQLRELEADALINRKVYSEVPPKVEYTLTDMGNSLIPLLKEMQKWSEKNITPQK